MPLNLPPLSSLLMLFAGLTLTVSASTTPSPAKPWTRWWWPGSAVDEAGLTRQLEQFAAAGLGGVEITPIYGVRGAEARNVAYLSPRWMELLAHTGLEAQRLGLGVDMATGTGWPFGGPWVAPEDGSQKLVLTDGRLAGTPTNMKVKRAAPGAEGLVIDPYSPAALERYLAPFTAAFAGFPTDLVRAQFHDSFEYYESGWTPALAETFRAMHGYDLQDHAAALFAKEPADPVFTARLKADYRATLGKLHLDYLRTWADWSHARGWLVRNQSHGAPANLLDLYGAVDIPETETFGSTPFSIPGLRREWTSTRDIPDRIALAEQLRAENDKRLQQGLMAPIDVMQAESTKAAAEIELIRANSFLVETENRLRALIFSDFLAAADTRFELLDPLREIDLTASLPALRNLALDRNAEYQVALQRVEAEHQRVRYARNQFLPRVDLQASVGLNGLGENIGTSFSDYSERTSPDYSIGVVGSLPITFAQERARLRESMLRLREAEYEVQRTINRIYEQVHTAHTRVVSAMQRATSATRAVEAAASALEAEQKRLTNGLTTSFNVLRLQDELAQARVNRLEAVAEGQKALAILWGVTGILFERYEITLVEAPGADRRT